MTDQAVDLIVHGPPGSAPPVLAAALAAAAAEAEPSAAPWRLVARGADPGVDAMQTLSERAGDPYVLSTCTPVFIQAPLIRGLPLTHRRLTPIARLVSDRYLLVVHAEGPWRDAADFLAGMRARPTRTGGYFAGGINHLLALSLAAETGALVDFTVVPDEPQVWRDIAAGDLDWGSGVAAEILPHVEVGLLRPIAAFAEARLPAFPDVPTLAECGVPISFRLWRGVMGPPDLTPAEQSRWHDVLHRLRQTESWRAYLARNGQADDVLPGAAFAAFLEEEWRWYEARLGEAGCLPAKTRPASR
jgi:putative tricarboxylic transport membrane protein